MNTPNTPDSTISSESAQAASSPNVRPDPRLTVAGLNQGFETDDGVRTALFSGLNFSVGAGEIVSIVGRSGAPGQPSPESRHR